MPVQGKLEEEVFPSLPIRKQKECTSTSRRSSISSVSSMSVCSQATQDPTPWFKKLVQDAVARRRVFCKCPKCDSRVGPLNRRKWDNLKKNPCVQANTLHKGTVAKIVSMKKYGKKGDLIVFVFVKNAYTVENYWGDIVNQDVSGWVYPDCLGGVKAVRSALQQKKVAENLNSLKKDFEAGRKPRVERKAVADYFPAPAVIAVPFQSQYQFNELVLARDGLGHSWYQAEVAAINPLRLKCSGWDNARVFDERNVKKHPSSKFVAVRNMDLRTQENPKSFVKKTISKGIVLDVVQMKGFHARITSPECGWVQMRNMNQLFAIEENHQFQKVPPTIFLGGLPLTATRTSVTAALREMFTVRFAGDEDGRTFSNVTVNVVPSSLHLFAQGDSLSGYLQLSNPRHYKKVVGKKLEVDGKQVSCEFCLNYLRCKAARELRRN